MRRLRYLGRGGDRAVDSAQVEAKGSRTGARVSVDVSLRMGFDGCDGEELTGGRWARVLQGVPAGACRGVERLARRTTAARRGTRTMWTPSWIRREVDNGPEGGSWVLGTGVGFEAEGERERAGAGCSLVEEKQVRKQQTSEEGRGRAVQRSFSVG